jgi:hypothetical protein
LLTKPSLPNFLASQISGQEFGYHVLANTEKKVHFEMGMPKIW